MTDDRWQHNLCERCWFSVTLHGDEDPRGRNPRLGYRNPVRLADDPIGTVMDICCHCADVTVFNARIRQDAARLVCQGRHDPASVRLWANPVVARHLPPPPA